MKLKFNLKETCFYIFWFFLQLGKGLGLVASDKHFLLLVACGLPFAIGKLFLTKWTNRELLSCIAINLLGLATAIRSGTTTYLLSAFCITAVKDMDIKSVLKVNLYVRGPMFVLRTTMAILGYADMESYYRYENGIQTIRYALGYGNANTAQFELFMLIALAVYLYREKLLIYHYVIALFYSCFIFRYTDSRTPLVLTFVFVVGMFMLRYRCVSKLVAYWADKSWYVVGIASLLGCISYVYIPAFRELGTFSSRFLTAVVTITGNRVPLFGMPGITTDLGYVYILYSAGLIMSVLFFVGVSKVLRVKRLREDRVLLWAFICLAVFNMIEHYAYSVLSNGLLLYLSYAVYPRMRSRIN